MSKERKVKKNSAKNGKAAEKLFWNLLKSTDLEINQNPPSIRCDNPVENKRGKKTKIVTQPDFKVTDPESGNSKLVEVTKGNGDNPHKDSQMRVVEEAGRCDDYVIVDGTVLAKLEEVEGLERTRLARLMLGLY